MLFGLLLIGCGDPPLPEPLPARPDIPSWSTAPYVQWQGPTEPGNAPWALIIDVPNGPIDQLLHDFDVATVLNDRFSAWFITPATLPEFSAKWGNAALLFIDARGCLLAPPSRPETPGALISQANKALRAGAARSKQGGDNAIETNREMTDADFLASGGSNAENLQFPVAWRTTLEGSCN